MDELISVRVLAKLAGTSAPITGGWSTFVDGLGNGIEYWSLVGAISRLSSSRSVQRPTESRQPYGLKASLLRLERELYEWLRDPFAPLDYFVSLLAETSVEGSDWHWSASMSSRARLADPPLGVRVVPLAAESLGEVLAHLNRGFVRDIETFGQDERWVDAFLARVGALERWLCIDLETKLDTASLTAYLKLKRQKGWRDVTIEAIRGLPGRVPERLRSELMELVQTYLEPLQQDFGPPLGYLVGRSASLAFSHYKTPHHSFWW